MINVILKKIRLSKHSVFRGSARKKVQVSQISYVSVCELMITLNYTISSVRMSHWLQGEYSIIDTKKTSGNNKPAKNSPHSGRK